MKSTKQLFAILVCASLLSCTTAADKKNVTGQTGAKLEGDPLMAEKLMLSIKEINDNAPATINTSFSADGVNNGQKFKVEGTALFDRKGYYKIAVVDYVFRSKVIEAYRELDSLYFYYPAEKKLLIDAVNKIDIYRYTAFQTSFELMHSLFTGGIPLIGLSKVTKCVAGDKPDSYNLMLQNNEYMQNIYFNSDIPERIMIIHRTTRDRMEIYLKSSIKRNKGVNYKNIRITAPERNISANINFISPLLDGVIEPEKFKCEVFKKDVEVIRIN